jgi:hypothetical protein
MEQRLKILAGWHDDPHDMVVHRCSASDVSRLPALTVWKCVLASTISKPSNSKTSLERLLKVKSVFYMPPQYSRTTHLHYGED